MKKIKLFMMLALLVAGVSNVMGARTYTVTFNPSNINGKVKATNASGYVKLQKTYNGYPVYVKTTVNNSGNRVTLTPYYYGPSYWSSDNDYREISDNSVLDALSKDNIYYYITVVQVNGYVTNSDYLTISGNTISIQYVRDTSTTWPDGDFIYSTKFVKSSSEVILLPAGEVAISLNLNETGTVTDVISYNPQTSYGSTYVENWNGDELTRTTNATTTATDDDGDGYGTSASYKCLGQLDANMRVSMGSHSANAYFYERTHDIKFSDVTDVEIPATVTKGNDTYKVTAIQKWGFCYNQTHQTLMDYCGSTTGTLHNNINDHSNYYLQSLTFAEGSNIKYIGDYAFMSCNKLAGKVEIPWTVESLGQGAFECCNSLEEVELLACADMTNTTYYGKTKIDIIRDFTFWSCQKLKTVILADGVTTIEGQGYGSPFQYMPALTTVKLPNTLTYIGPHFLCSCTAIEKLTIPASVTYIDGACFHGCSKLNEVYVLGEPADLQGLDGTSKTFDENAACCGLHVNNATFYVAQDELDNYKNHEVWGELKDPNDYGNKLLPIPTNPVVFTAGKWSTAIFPKRVSNATGAPIAANQTAIDAIFGTGTIVAKMTAAQHDAKDESLYHLTFTQQSEIPCGVPLMIKPANTRNYPMFGDDDMNDRNFRDDANSDHSLDIQSSNDNAIIMMKGKYVKEDPLNKWDFVFKSEQQADNTYKYTFRKFVEGHVYSNPCRCWWRINLAGSNGGQSTQQSKMMPFSTFEDENGNVTAIEDVQKEPRFVIDAIYDLQGRRIEIEQEELPAGLFIVNGKKVIVK